MGRLKNLKYNLYDKRVWQFVCQYMSALGKKATGDRKKNKEICKISLEKSRPITALETCTDKITVK